MRDGCLSGQYLPKVGPIRIGIERRMAIAFDHVIDFAFGD
jgi:hypothetical protein